MRSPFTGNSRVNLVIYRERWGNTPWTRVESTAIKEACLEHGWDGLFFFMVEPSDKPPKWLPTTHVRFNYGDFSLEQAIGAIKARVQEQGGRYVPLTPLKKAELLQAEKLYQRERSSLDIQKVIAKIGVLIEEMQAQCEQVKAGGNLIMEYETQPNQAFIIRHEQVGMIVRWDQRWANSLEGSHLSVEEYNGRLIFNREIGRLIYLDRPQLIKKIQYEAELSRSREYGWRQSGSKDGFMSSTELATQALLRFMNLIERATSGKLRVHGR